MAAYDYGRFYWGVKVTKDVSPDGEIYANADTVRIEPDGALVLLGKEEAPLLIIAAKKWQVFFAASCLDGHPVAVDHWRDEVSHPWEPEAKSVKKRLDTQRNFDAKQKAAIYKKAKGRCQICSANLGDKWHADHVVPHSRGGKTSVENGMALCAPCNIRKHAKMLTVEE